MSKNKKIKNAKTLEVEGIHFKSVFESKCYKTLKEYFPQVQYEATTFTLWEGFKPLRILYYTQTKHKDGSKEWGVITKKIQAITYTPDFSIAFRKARLMVLIEAKGFENDAFPMKKKMLLKQLEESGCNWMYLEVFNKAQLIAAITVIQHYVKELEIGEGDTPKEVISNS